MKVQVRSSEIEIHPVSTATPLLLVNNLYAGLQWLSRSTRCNIDLGEGCVSQSKELAHQYIDNLEVEIESQEHNNALKPVLDTVDPV